MQRAITEHAKDLRRSSRLIAALDEFFNQGVKGAWMEDVAPGAGLSKGTWYQYFASNQDLFKALIEEVAIPRVSITPIRASSGNSDPGALRQLMLFTPKLMQATTLAKLIKVLISDAKAFPVLLGYDKEQIIGQVFTMLETILRRRVSSGEWQ